MVYNLYGLTAEEIAIVEGGQFSLSDSEKVLHSIG